MKVRFVALLATKAPFIANNQNATAIEEARMRAVVITEPGGPEVLVWQEVPDAVAGPGEVLVRVTASAVNRADLLQRQGFYPPPRGASTSGMAAASQAQRRDQLAGGSRLQRGAGCDAVAWVQHQHRQQQVEQGIGLGERSAGQRQGMASSGQHVGDSSTIVAATGLRGGTARGTRRGAKSAVWGQPNHSACG